MTLAPKSAQHAEIGELMSRWIVALLVSVVCMDGFGQPPKVAVDVATAATQAAKEDQPVLPDDFANRRVNATWIAPAEPEVRIEPGVTFYTADGDWCQPCKKQAKILVDAGAMTPDGTPIWPFRIVKTRTRTVPQWRVDDGSGKALIGPREASSLKKWIDYHAKKVSSVSSVVRYTQAELDQWIRANYTQSTQLTADVTPRSNVWNHLTDGSGGTHAFTAEQVNGLAQWVALALHNEVHLDKPRITPFKAVNQSGKNSPDKWVVEVDGRDSRSIVLALAEFVRRQDDASPAVQGFLPAIPLDVNDDLLKVLDALLSKDGYTGNGLRVSWPAGKRRMVFEPGITVVVRKVVEVDATITAIEFDGREVTLSLAGTIVRQLTVRLK